MLQARMLAPGRALIEAIAADTLNRVPALQRERLGPVAVEVAELADDALLDARDILDPFEVTTPHAGLPLSAAIDLPLPAGSLRLYRRALIDRWVDEGVALEQVVADAVRHEVRHMIERAPAVHAGEEEPVRRIAAG